MIARGGLRFNLKETVRRPREAVWPDFAAAALAPGRDAGPRPDAPPRETRPLVGVAEND
jgi:hypothetical protein